jgi:hypothetical protein
VTAKQEPDRPPSEAERTRMVDAYRRSRDRPKPVRVKVDGIEDKLCRVGPDHDDDRGWLIRLTDALGTSSEDFALGQLSALLNAAKIEATSEQQTATINGMLAMVAGVQPRNEIEGMLAVQMAATHVQALALLERAKRAQHLPQFEANGNMAVKLLRTFTAQTEGLAKLRRGGSQTVRVEHVHVHAGGQAIVGNVSTPGGGGGAGRNGVQAHAAGGEINEPGALAPEGGVPLWSPDALGKALPVACGEREGALPHARRREG